MGYSSVYYPADNKALKRIENYMKSNKTSKAPVAPVVYVNTNLKQKQDNSFTLTKTKESKTVKGGVRDLGKGRSSSSTMWNMRKLSKTDKKIVDLQLDLNYQYDSNSRVIGGVGRQFFFDSLFGVTTLTRSNFLLWSPLDIVDMELAVRDTGTSTLQPTTKKVFLESGVHELRINNSDLGNVRLMIWDCVPRENITNGADVHASPVKLLDKSSFYLSNATTGTAYTLNHTAIGASVYKAETFTLNYKIINQTKVDLEPGCEHIHKVITKPNSSFAINRILSSSALPVTAFRNKSIWTLIAAEGLLGHTAGTTGAANVVSTSDISLDVVSTKKYKICAFEENRTKDIITTTLGTSGNLNFINEQTGLHVTDSQAE